MDHVKNFLSTSHKGDSTEVCSETAPEVVQQTVKPHAHTESTEAVDHEQHIHHHQHRVQPITHQETLPTEHKHVMLPEQTREIKEDMAPEHREKLEQQRSMHQHTHTVHPTTESAATIPAVTNTHVHHHVHETIQPVIQRETIQPTTVHTTVPVHHVHHKAPIVHEHTILPTVTLEDFKNKVKGPHSHSDESHSHQFYEGAPRVGGQQPVAEKA